MSKVIIIDDEPLARSIVKEYLQKHPQLELIQECNDGFEGLKAIQQHQPDLIFLDIQMPKITGFEMLELLPKLDFHLVITTSVDKYAIQAIRASAEQKARASMWLIRRTSSVFGSASDFAGADR